MIIGTVKELKNHEYRVGITPDHVKGYVKDGHTVYVEKNASEDRDTSKRTYTEEEADKTVAFLRAQGLDAHKTYGQKPKPFLRPALYENREEILKKLGDSIGNA